MQLMHTRYTDVEDVEQTLMPVDTSASAGTCTHIRLSGSHHRLVPQV